MDKLVSILVFIGRWCDGDLICEKKMIECAQRHIKDWSEEKILLQCFRDPKK